MQERKIYLVKNAEMLHILSLTYMKWLKIVTVEVDRLHI